MINFKLGDLVEFFLNADEKLETSFKQNAIMQSFPKGTYISMEGDSCKFFPIVKSGLIRVFKLGPRGQEMTLYRIEPGQSCILTISCLLSNHDFPAIAMVEEDCEVVLIEERTMKEWMSKYSIWSNYIFDYLSQVLLNVLKVLENVSFKNTDIRILEYLITASAQQGDSIITTHQQIALEIGTAREVVSRSLKSLERQNLVRLSRGKINVPNLKKLQKELTLLK